VAETDSAKLPQVLNIKEKNMVLNITEQEFMDMKAAALDADKDEALRIIRHLIKRIEQQKNAGLKSHLEG
jgi:hypothetical protein